MARAFVLGCHRHCHQWHRHHTAVDSAFWGSSTGFNIVYSWVYQPTNGSILMAILLHLSLNSGGTITSWLYPDMAASQKLLFYATYVASVWVVVALLFSLRQSRATRVLGAMNH